MMYQRTIVKKALSSALLICCASAGTHANGYGNPYTINGDDRSCNSQSTHPTLPESTSSDSPGSVSPPKQNVTPPLPIQAIAQKVESSKRKSPAPRPAFRDAISGTVTIPGNDGPEIPEFLEPKLQQPPKSQRRSRAKHGARRKTRSEGDQKVDELETEDTTPLLMEAIHQSFPIQTNPVFQSREFESLTDEEQTEIKRKTKFQGWNQEKVMQLLKSLSQQWKLIDFHSEEDSKRFFVNEDGIWKWRYTTLLRAYNFYNDHIKRDGVKRMRYTLGRWENGYVLNEEFPNGMCGHPLRFSWDYFNELPAEDLKAEVYEYCRTGIISRNHDKNDDAYDEVLLKVPDSRNKVLRNIRMDAFKKLIQNKMPNGGESWWLGLQPFERVWWLRWVESSYEVKVMEYEVIRPEQDRQAPIKNIGECYDDYVRRMAEKAEAQKQSAYQQSTGCCEDGC